MVNPFAFMRNSVLALLLGVAGTTAIAFSFSDLTHAEASSGLKAALEKGALEAVGKLGVENGFLGNEQVRIELPGILSQARPFLKMSGRGKQLDDLELAMNRAAESAMPLAKPLLINAVKSMSVRDAKDILRGGDTAVTDFFREKTSGPLAMQFLPLVKGITDRSGLSARYNGAMAHAAKFNLVAEQHATVEGYVTRQALEGLFYMIGEEEKAIRRDPIGSGSKIIGKVFGSMR